MVTSRAWSLTLCAPLPIAMRRLLVTLGCGGGCGDDVHDSPETMSRRQWPDRGYWALSSPRVIDLSRKDRSMYGAMLNPFTLSFDCDRMVIPSANCSAFGVGTLGTTSPIKKS